MMRNFFTTAFCSALCATCALSTTVDALNGYFPTGFGVRSRGMGGTAVANPQDALVIASNPAGVSFLQNRLDLSVNWFNPHRFYKYSGSASVPADAVVSQRDDFFIPAMAYSKHYDDCSTFAIAAYGNGGLNSTYPRDNPVFGNGNIGQVLCLDYMQLVIAPTYSRVVGQNQSLGVSLLYGLQRIRFKGLQGLAAFSSHPDHLTNKKFNWAQGLGARFGWMGEMAPGFTVGASYSTKIYMSKFHKYKGLLAQNGKLDIPAQFMAGLSWQATDCLLLAFDYQRVFYRHVKAIANGIQRLGPGNLGTNGGAGFGWKNLSVYKVGANYCYDYFWEFRAGYAYSNVVYPSTQVDFNILSPTVVKHHITLGTSYHIDTDNQVDVFYEYGCPGKKRGNSLVGLGRIKEKLWQQTLGINYSYLF